jgi:xanthine dehydrogenase YagR molybdenum-binding subunit
MAEYKWPEADKRALIGKRISRVDGPAKVSGRAKYSYDIHRPGMLYGKILRCPHAHAKIVSIDVSAAEKIPGVKAVKIIQDKGTEIRWAGDEVAIVAAVDEPTAADAVRAITVKYEVLPHLVVDTDPKAAGENAKPAAASTEGDPDKAFAEADVTVEGFYGLPVITHCCLEPHGTVAEWDENNNLLVHMSTQNVSGIAGQMAAPLEIPAGNIRVKQLSVGRGRPTVGLRARQGRGEKRRYDSSLAVRVMGQRRPGRRRLPAPALRIQHTESAQTAYRHRDQHR